MLLLRHHKHLIFICVFGKFHAAWRRVRDVFVVADVAAAVAVAVAVVEGWGGLGGTVLNVKC